MKEIPLHLGYDLRFHRNNEQTAAMQTFRWLDKRPSTERERGSQLMNRFIDRVIGDRAKVIIVSPHYDDQPLSTGELTYDLAEALPPGNVHVVNVFTQGGNLAQRRRQEDVYASQILGVQSHSLDFTDAAYRRVINPTKLRQKYINHSGEQRIYPYSTQLLGKTSKYDNTMLEQITVELRQKVDEITQGNNNFVIIAPIGIQRSITHVDHILTRIACEEAFDNVVYYADYPYLIAGKPPQQFIKDQDLLPATYRGAEPERRRRAVACHQSQIPELFKDRFLTFGRGLPEVLPEELYFIKNQ